MENSVIFEEKFNYGWPVLNGKKHNGKMMNNGQNSLASSIFFVVKLILLSIFLE